MERYQRKITIKNFADLGKIIFYWVLYSTVEIIKIIFRKSLEVSLFFAAMFFYQLADFRNDWTVWARLYLSIAFFIIWLISKNRFKTERRTE